MTKVDPKRSAAAKKGWETRRKQRAKAVKKIGKTLDKEQASLSKPQIKEWFSDKSMAEIYNTGVQYALVSKDGHQCHPFAYCKDFLQDAIWATIHKSKSSIHGFYYDSAKNPPVDLKATRVALRYRGKDKFREMCEKSLSFMQAMEKDMGFYPSQLCYGGKFKDEGSPVYLFVSDKRWMHSTVLFSLYTLSLRVGLNYEGGRWRDHFKGANEYVGRNDKRYTSSADKRLDDILKNRPEKLFASKMEDNYPKSIHISSMHHKSGIVCFGNGNVDAQFKKVWEK